MRKGMFVIAFALLLLAGNCFAAWESMAALAVMASVAALALVYMFGAGFGVEEAKFLAKDEMYQLVVTVILIVSFAGFSAGANEVSKSFSDGKYSTLQALGSGKLDESYADLEKTTDEIIGIANNVGTQSSKSAFCGLMGMGLSLSGCGGYRVLLPTISLASTTLAMGTAELQALKMMLLLGSKYAFTLLLPFGIFLRTFKFTRGAGGLLIGMAVSLYFVLPFTIAFFSYMYEDFEKTTTAFSTAPSFTKADCDPFNAAPSRGGDAAAMAADPKEIKNFEASSAWGGGIEMNEANAMKILQDFSGDAIEYYIYRVLLKATLTVIITIMIVIFTIQRVTAITGAEVDMSVLSRLA